MRPKDYPGDFEQPMRAFQVQRDWYEEYWLRPNTQPAAAKWRRLVLRFPFILFAATASALAVFIRSRTGGAI